MRRRLILTMLVTALAAPLVYSAQRPATPQNDLPETPGTFSILAFDPVTEEIGGAVQSRVFSVGNGVLWAEAGVGAVATQAIVDVSYGPKGLELLRQGLAPNEIVRRLLWQDDDPGYRGRPWPKAGRQFAVMNAQGEMAAYTGPEATSWAGDRQSAHATAQGNILAGPGVVEGMIKAYEESEFDANGQRNHISLRLVAALEAGQAAGGDTRGKQSAALLIVKKDAGVWLHNDVVLRLQVDDNPEPIAELRRLVEMSPPARQGRGRRGGGPGESR